jgi:hypothetical protein
MARGWESKSVEDQIEEGKRASEARPHTTADSRVTDQRLESLRLSRSRVQQQLAHAVYPAHREMLMKALQAIEREAEEIRNEASAKGEAP